MPKPPAIVRAYPVASFANAGKIGAISDLYSVYRREFAGLMKTRFRRFLQGDSASLNPKAASTKGAETSLSQSQYQGLLARVCESLKSHTAQLETRTLDLMKASSLERTELRDQVFFLCRTGQWTNIRATFVPRTLLIQDDFGNAVEVDNIRKQRAPVSPEAIAMAKCLLRRARKDISFPDVKRPRMLLDSRTGVLQEAKGKGFTHWLNVSTLNKGRKTAIPLKVHGYAAEAPGEFAKSMELGFADGELRITLFRKSTAKDWQDRFVHDGSVKEDETLALDWGMSTLIATSKGELLGRGWLDRIKDYDRKLTELAKQRQKLGLKTRSRRYDDLRRRIMGFVKSEIGRALNRLVSRYPKLKTLIVERLALFDSSLSRRMNRLLRTVGFGLFKSKLSELSKIRGFVIEEVNPAWSSQECPHCGFVHHENRKTQAVFRCILCGRQGHADAIAASNLERRSLQGASPFLPKGELLSGLYRRFTAFLSGAGHRYRARYDALSAAGIAFGARRALPSAAKAGKGSYNRNFLGSGVTAAAQQVLLVSTG